MQQSAIFLPVSVLAAWTMLVLLLVPIRRFAAGRAKKVTTDDFRYGESDRVPPDVAIANRAWMNLLEAPVLFYVACIVLFSVEEVDGHVINMAWAYVGLRVVHTLIHVTYNKVFHRLLAFAISNVVLASLWVAVITRIWQAPG